MQGGFSESALKSAVENMQDSFAYFSAVRNENRRIVDFKFEYINEAGCRSYSITKGECYGRRLLELFPYNSKTGLFDDYCNVVETGEPLTKESLIFEDTYKMKSLIRVLDIHATRFEDGFTLIWREVTQKKKVEEALIESEETIRALLNSITEAIVLCDLDGNVETINKTAAERYGKRPEDIIGKCIFDFMPAELAEKRKKYIYSNIPCGSPVHFTDMRSEMYLDNFLYPVFNSRGKAIKFVAFTQDITEQKQAEEAQRRLAAIVESSEEAIIGKTLDGIITSWNKAAEEMYGYTAKEVVGKSIYIIVPEERKSETELIISGIQKGERISHRETIRKTKDGRLIHVSVTISPVVDSDGKILGASSIAHDISARKRAERELALKNEELKVQRAEAIEANKLKSQFLANMSHELRTPLNSIIGFTTRVIKKGAGVLPEVQLDNLRIVKEEALHLLDLINSLLDYSKVEAGRMEVYKEVFNLVKVVEEVNFIVKTLMEGKPLEYEYELCSKESILISSDRIKIKQILINLLSNAIKYSERGKIKLSVSKKDKYYCMKVEDEGIGIAPENLTNIFDEFRQIDGSYTRKVGGTGLGLSITKKFTEMLGGRIKVVSTLGVGSCFIVHIPMEMEGPKEYMEKLDSDEKSLPPYRIKVACIDDDNNVQRLYKQYLNEQGYEAIPLYGGENVISEIEKIKPDVILLDIMLPNKDGWEILAGIKNNPSIKKIPVIMISVLSEKNLAYRMKADEYLIKPVSQEELLDTIVRTISKRDGLEILIADDDENFLNLIGQFLSEQAVFYRFARNGEEAITEIENKKPDLAILGLTMPKKDGFVVSDYITNNEKLKDIPVVIVTEKDLSRKEKEELLLRTNLVVQKSGAQIERVMQMLLKKIKERSEYGKDSCN